MKQLLIIVMLFLVFCQDLISQDRGQNKAVFDIHIMPYTLLDYTPRLRLGVEYYPGDKFSYCLELGVGNEELNAGRLKGMIWGENYSFYEIRPEIKYYYYNRDNIFSLYMAGELFALQMKDRFIDGYYQQQNSPYIVYYDDARFYKHKLGFHIKSGLKVTVLKRVSLDFYGGIGMASRKITYNNVLNPVLVEDFIFVEWLPQTFRFPGESNIFHMTMGMKIGFSFVESD